MSWLALLALRLVALLERSGLLTFYGLISWLTLLVLQILHSIALLEQTGLLNFNDLASSLTLLAETGLTWTLTSFTLLAGLHWYKPDSLKLNKTAWLTLENVGKLCSFNKKEIVDWTFCLVILLYDVVLLVEERLIWLHREFIVNVIVFASLTLRCSMSWSKSL